jgi:biotin carboxyl carrier protein
MKMQIEITAGVAGIVKEVHAVPGQQVEGGSLLVVLEPGA